MKNKIEAFFKYLMALKTTSAGIELQCDERSIDYWSGEIDTNNRGVIQLPSNFELYITELFDEYSNTIYDDSFYNVYYDHSEWYTVYVDINVQKKRITFTSEIIIYDSESTGTGYDFEDGDSQEWKDKVYEYLDSNNTNSIRIKYNGGGDSGELESSYNDETNQMVDLDGDIEDICYSLLNSEFGGWEINEGSSGEILIKREGIYIEHNWNTEERIASDLDLILDIKDLPE